MNSMILTVDESRYVFIPSQFSLLLLAEVDVGGEGRTDKGILGWQEMNLSGASDGED